MGVSMKLFLTFITGMALCSALAIELDLSGKGYLRENPILAPVRNGMSLTAKEDSVKPIDLAVMRKRTPEGKYQLFQGRLKHAAKNFLTAYKPTGIDSWRLLLGAKFLSGTHADAIELSDVVWDGSLLLVPGKTDTLVAINGADTLRIPAAPAQPVILKVESTPQGASVSVRGATQGATPLEFQWLGGEWVWIRLDKPGFFSWEDIVHASKDAPTSIAVNLRARPTFQDGSAADSNGLDAHGSQDILAVQAMLQDINTLPLDERDPNIEDFLAEYLDTLKQRLYVEYIPPGNLSVDAWDSAKAGLPVRIWYGSNDFDFGFVGAIPCTKEESFALANLLKANQRSTSLKTSERVRRTSWPSAHATASLDGWIRLKYRNWATTARANSRVVHRYFATESLELAMPGQTVPLTGDFVPASYIKQSKDWEGFIKATQEAQ